MATAILIPQNGTLVAISLAGTDGQGAIPALITVQGLKETGSSAELLVTSFEHSAEVAQRVVPTIGGPEYLYVFGDKLHEIGIGVVMYPGKCGDAGKEKSNGYSAAWKFYQDYRISPKQVRVVSVTFGSTQISGLVVGFKVTASASQGFAVIEGLLQLKGWVSPENQSNSGAAGAAPASSATPSPGDSNPDGYNPDAKVSPTGWPS